MEDPPVILFQQSHSFSSHEPSPGYPIQLGPFSCTTVSQKTGTLLDHSDKSGAWSSIVEAPSNKILDGGSKVTLDNHDINLSSTM